VSNPWQDSARQRKATAIANVIEPEWPRLAVEGYVLEDLLREEAANVRRLAETQAGQKPGSKETWEMVIGLLREREAARNLCLNKH